MYHFSLQNISAIYMQGSQIFTNQRKIIDPKQNLLIRNPKRCHDYAICPLNFQPVQLIPLWVWKFVQLSLLLFEIELYIKNAVLWY